MDKLNLSQNMRWIKGCIFRMNGVEYIITAVILKGLDKPLYYEFSTTNWDEEVKHYIMEAQEFNRKVNTSHYIRLQNV